MAARDAGLPLPAGLHLVSPWANLTNKSPAYQAKAETDFIITQAGIDDFADNYLGGHDPNAPLASPVFADLAGLPPMLIQVGSEEVLMCEFGAARRARRLRRGRRDAAHLAATWSTSGPSSRSSAPAAKRDRRVRGLDQIAGALTRRGRPQVSTTKSLRGLGPAQT